MGQTENETATIYAKKGFVAPIDILSTDEARRLRDDFEAAEAELADDPARLMATLTVCCRVSTR